MDNCTIDCIQLIGNFTQAQTCAFTKRQCIQDTFQYVQTYYCDLNQSFTLLIFVSLISLLLIYYALKYLTDDYLAPCVEQFIVKLNMSQALAGITFLAFANGAPDIITAIVAGSSSSGSTALIPFGSIYGAALFGMAFILAMVIEYSEGKQLKLKKREALIPLGFYIGGTIYLICISLFYKKMNIVISLIFLSLYLVYIGIIIYDEKQKHNQQKSQKSQEQGGHQKFINTSLLDVEEKLKTQLEQTVQKNIKIQESEGSEGKSGVGMILNGVRILWKYIFMYTVPPISAAEWSPLRSLIGLIWSPFICSLSYGFVDSFEKKLFSLPYFVIFSIPTIPLLIHTIYCIIKKVKPTQTIFYSIYSFVIIVCWITFVCSILINLMELLQLLTNINSVFLGLTVLAGAASIGDYLSITAFAKKGYASTAVAGVFSGQLMNFLLGLGISNVLNSLDGEHDYIVFDFQGSSFDKISDAIVVGVIGMSLLYMAWIFWIIIKNNGKLQLSVKKFALIYYFVFVGVALVLCVMTDFYREISCDI